MAGLCTGTFVDFRIIDGCLAITKIEQQCVLCGSSDHLAEWRGKYICYECLQEIRAE